MARKEFTLDRKLMCAYRPNVVGAHCQRGGGKVAHTFSRQSSHPGVPINCGRLRRDRDTQSARDSISIKGQTNNIHPYAGQGRTIGQAHVIQSKTTNDRNPQINRH